MKFFKNMDLIKKLSFKLFTSFFCIMLSSFCTICFDLTKYRMEFRCQIQPFGSNLEIMLGDLKKPRFHITNSFKPLEITILCNVVVQFRRRYQSTFLSKLKLDKHLLSNSIVGYKLKTVLLFMTASSVIVSSFKQFECIVTFVQY